MEITTFMIAVYCLIDDNVDDQWLRKWGSKTPWRDNEVPSIVVAREFLRLDTESSIFTHFVAIVQTSLLSYVKSLAQPFLDRQPIFGW